MSVFDIYLHPDSGYRAVKQGFNWPAILGGVWFVFKGMWSQVIAYWLIVAALIAQATLGNESGNRFILVSGIGLLVAFLVSCGAWGNDYWRDHLLREGFKKVKTTEASNEVEAVADLTRN